MTDTKWTPGPWDLDGGDILSCVTAPAAPEHTDIAYLTLENHAANARLIAAAPEMYDALARIVFDWDGEPEDMADAIAVLAKARGED